MDTDEVRAKAAELSITMSAHVTSAMIVHGGLQSVNEIAPLALAPEIEEYIRMGKLPKPIPVTKWERK